MTAKSLVYVMLLIVCSSGGLAGRVWASDDVTSTSANVAINYRQSETDLLAGEVMGVAYSGFREGQHPDRGAGALNPSRSEIIEDLNILRDYGFRLLRLYDSGENSSAVLQVIRENDLPFKVLLGTWLDAELSNHEGCPWLTEPIPPEELTSNTRQNAQEIARSIALANRYPDIVVAVNVGNEALVDWTDHMVSLESAIDYVRQVKRAVNQPVTVADNYLWWVEEGQELAREVDFLGVHTYPQWEHKGIEEAHLYTMDNIERVRKAIPDKPIVILEAGWATTAVEFPESANAANQQRYFTELKDWAAQTNTTVLFFEAFDETWKGDSKVPDGAEKHWGLFNVDRSPKQAMREQAPILYDPHAVAWAVNVGGGEYRGLDSVDYAADESISGGQSGELEAVDGTQGAGVYQSYRKGQLHVKKPLANGVYDLTFHFVEPDAAAAGERVFDVLVQGVKRIEDLDISRLRGGKAPSALRRTIAGVVVEEGQLDIRLVSADSAPVLAGLLVRHRRSSASAWELVWADEFNYRGKPDSTKWNIEQWAPGHVNREAQAYTEHERNLRVESGSLILEAHRGSEGGAAYTSARIHSQGKGDFLYGRVDFRARLPKGRGTWAALWMLPSDPYRYARACDSGQDWHGNAHCDAWPNSGEIDIMEYVGYEPDLVHGTVHNRSFSGGGPKQNNGTLEAPGVYREFHIYSLEWTPQRIDIYKDGSCFYSYLNEGDGWEQWPYNHPFHLIMNLAIGGDWGEAGGPIDNDMFPTAMEVDYVRVYKRTGTPTPNTKAPG